MAEKRTISVPSDGRRGNAFALLGEVKRAMKEAGWTRIEIERFIEEATSGDYDHMLHVINQYCDDVEEE